MENKFNFNSQICTTREQSERLLALGLKPETADMVLCEPFDYEKRKYPDGYVKIVLVEGDDFCKEDIPAWSLHRLIEILDTNPCVFYTNCSYDNIIDRIVDFIKERFIDTRYMNEEYLDEEE